MIEIAGAQTLVSFDGRVLELFSPRTSRRIHVEQILGAEVQAGGLLVGDGATLGVRLVDGQELMLPFPAARRSALERLVAELPVRL